MAKRRGEPQQVVETRYVPVQEVELRMDGGGEDGEPRKLSGYAAVFNSWSPVYEGWDGPFRERIAPGFFDDVLDNDVRALYNHEANFVLGRTSAGTLRIAKDGKGLMMENELPDTSFARDLAVSMERGDVTGASFSFTIDRKLGDDWQEGEDGVMERTLLKATNLFDVGPVSYPFYPETDVSIASRSWQRWQEEHAEDREEAAPVILVPADAARLRIARSVVRMEPATRKV